MKYSALLICWLVSVSTVLALDDPRTSAAGRNVRITPLYQTWSLPGGSGASEFSSMVSFSTPLREEIRMWARASQAATGGDLESMNGLSDIQLGVHYQPGASNVSYALGVNLPSGKRRLNAREFESTYILSSTVLNFQVPNYGQGLNISPAIAFAFPASRNLVFGVGASFQYKGPFQPLDGLDNYDPGDEIVLTGGLDAVVGETSTLSADLILTSYGTDRIGSTEVFDAGSRFIIGLTLAMPDKSQNGLTLATRYRSKAKGEVSLGNVFVPEEEKLEPNQFELGGLYHKAVSPKVSGSVMLQGRFFEETANPLSGGKIVSIGLLPEIALSKQAKLLGKLIGHFGTLRDDASVSGTEIGLGLAVSF